MSTYLPVQSLWIGSNLSVMERLCIESYCQNGHEFHLYTYDEIINAPNCTIQKDAREIIPFKEVFKDQFGGFVNFSNLFRYTLLYQKGGWWVDMDTVCLKPFSFDEDFVFSSENVNPLQRIAVNTTYIKSLPNEKFLTDCMDFIRSRGTTHIHWGELGVNLISQMIFRNQLQRFIQLPQVFCPVSGYELAYFTEYSDEAILDNSFALHWWNELWRRNNLNKEMKYPPASLYERLKQKYLTRSKLQVVEN